MRNIYDYTLKELEERKMIKNLEQLKYMNSYTKKE